MLNLTTKHQLSTKELLGALYNMLMVRRFEERCSQLYGMGKIGGFCHLYIGQEAVLAGAISSKKTGDSFVTSYRCHGHGLLLGIEPSKLLAELLGKSSGCSKGKGGSMHIFNKEQKFYGGHGIVGAQVSIGTGIAFAEKYNNTDNVCYTFFGDGAANQGQIFESFNMAALWNLPVIYIIENNEYAMGTSVSRSTASTDLYKRGESLGIEGVQINGMKLDECYTAFKEAATYVRTNKVPVIIEAKTYRYKGHSMSDPAKYREKFELDEYKKNDPIEYVKNILINKGTAEDTIKNIEKEIKNIILNAVDFAENSPLPNVDELYKDVYL